MLKMVDPSKTHRNAFLLILKLNIKNERNYGSYIYNLLLTTLLGKIKYCNVHNLTYTSNDLDTAIKTTECNYTNIHLNRIVSRELNVKKFMKCALQGVPKYREFLQNNTFSDICKS